VLFPPKGSEAYSHRELHPVSLESCIWLSLFNESFYSLKKQKIRKQEIKIVQLLENQ
jgi:hypothetical protein